jgi:hypothetical protein
LIIPEDVLSNALNILKNLIQNWLNVFGSILGNLGQLLSTVVGVFNLTLLLPIGLFGLLGLIGTLAFTFAFFDLGKIILGGIFSIVEGVINGLINLAIEVLRKLRDVWNAIANAFNQWFTGIVLWFREKLKAILVSNITIIGTWSRIRAFQKKPTFKNFVLIFTAGLGSYIIGVVVAEFITTLIPTPSTRVFPIVPPMGEIELPLPTITLDRTPLQQEIRLPTGQEIFVKSDFNFATYLSRLTNTVHQSIYSLVTFASQLTKIVHQSAFNFSTFLSQLTKIEYQSTFSFSTYISKIRRITVQSSYNFATYLSKLRRISAEEITADVIDILIPMFDAFNILIPAEQETVLTFSFPTITSSLQTAEQETLLSPSLPTISVEIV